MRPLAGNQISCSMALGKSFARGVFRHDDVLIFQTGAEDGSATTNETKIQIGCGRYCAPAGFVDRKNMSTGVGDQALVQEVSNTGYVFRSIDNDGVVVPCVIQPHWIPGSSKWIISVIDHCRCIALDLVVDQRWRVGYG